MQADCTHPAANEPVVHRKRTLYISPRNDVRTAILDAARSATISLHVYAYGFTLAELGDILIQKQKAGLSVGVCADKTQSAGRTQKALLQRLVDAGVPVVISVSEHSTIMHQKVILIDHEMGPLHNHSRVAYGSYNLSDGAQTQNNHMTIDNDPTICAAFFAEYERSIEIGKEKCHQLVVSNGRLVEACPVEEKEEDGNQA